MAKKSKLAKNNFLNAVLYILVGALFCVFRAGMLNIMLTVIGVLFIAQAVLDLLHHYVQEGIINLAIGIVIIVGGWLFVEIILIIFGALLLVKGLTDLISTRKSKNTWNTVYAILTMIVGIMLIVSKWAMLDWFFIVLGVVFIVNGVTALLGTSKKK